MEDYIITIREILERKVTVSAENEIEAKEMVETDYYNQMHILDESDFVGVQFIKYDLAKTKF